MARPAFDPHPRRVLAVLKGVLHERPGLAVAAMTVIASAFFIAFPVLDLAVSRLFFDPVSGFPEGAAVLEAFRDLGALAEWALALALIVPIFAKLLAPESRLLVKPRTTLFGLSTLALGPGLLVNLILKEFWGRARPREIVEFGGEATFTPAWWIAAECERNCSFVSGEASAAFWLLALAMVAPLAWRRAAAIGALAITACVSFARIAAGGHFLSDVVLAWLLTLLVMLGLRELVMRRLGSGFDTTAEAGLARPGRRIRAWWATRRASPPGAP